MRKKFLLRLRAAAAVWIVSAVLAMPGFAAGELIPVGEPVGIELTVDGVLVAGTSEVESDAGTVCPAREAGIRAGDVIVAIDGQSVDSAEALAAAVAALTDGAELTVTRSGRERTVFVIPAVEAGTPRLGLLLRDGVSGIGTVTYIDPETGAFGALGHGVNDLDSGALLPVEGGSICRAQIVDVKQGQAGMPGELAGSFSAGDILGRIEKNTACGIFGVMRGGELRGAVPVASPSEVESGPATILACAAGRQVQEYAVEISRSGMAGGDGRDLMVRVTDPALLSLTGGIVQGMSGSPILQNGKLVGAVTHVLVADPTRGYGIFAERMLEAADTAASDAAA